MFRPASAFGIGMVRDARGRKWAGIPVLFRLYFQSALGEAGCVA